MATLDSARFVLAVKDLAVSTDYYMNVLGFVRDHGDGSDGWSFLSRDNMRVMLGECRDEVAADETGNHSWYAHVLVTEVDRLYEEFSQKGVRFLAYPKSQPWGIRDFCIKTLDGHRIVFGELLH